MYHQHRDQREARLNEKRRDWVYGPGASNVAVLALDGKFDPVVKSPLQLADRHPRANLAGPPQHQRRMSSSSPGPEKWFQMRPD